MSAETGDIVSRMYGGFRGVDFRGDEINLVRSPDSLNMWKDYKETDSIRTRPGAALHTAFSEPVYGVFFFNGEMLVHSGETLYRVANGKTVDLFTGLNRAQSDSFTYESTWYFKDGKNYLTYNGTSVKPVGGYVPTTSIARRPAGGGTVHEDVNLITGWRINTFLADGVSTEFYLDSTHIDANAGIEVKVNGKTVNNFAVHDDAGKVVFTSAPPAPMTDGQDNVSVKFKKVVDGADKILECTLLQVFDNRVFFSGNKDYPNTLWHCSLDDPTYCSDLDYYNEGLDNALIKGMVAGNNALWVFREPSDANTTVFYHTPTIDNQYGKIYPSQHSSVTIGCVGKAVNFNDDIVFFSERGMEGISGDITTEQVLAHRSSLVDRKLITEADYKDMVLAEWEGYLMVFIGNHVYLADSRAMVNNDNHMEYEYFYWDMGMKVTCAKVERGVLYIGTESGVYTLNDNNASVESWWVTPKDKFNAPQKLKTTNKRGCVAEATGDVTVYAKTEDTDFGLVGAHNGVTDYFVSRMRLKKWKDIQLKFYSQTRFSLESVTLDAVIGGYIKR